MTDYILLFISIGAFGLGAWYFLSRRGRRSLSVRLAVTAGTSAAALAAMRAFLEPARQVLSPMLPVEIMQLFTLNTDYGSVADAVRALSAPAAAKWAVAAYVLLLYTAPPIVFGSFIADMLTALSPGLRLALMGRRSHFVFSAVTERSVTLAESVRAAHPKAAVVFLNAAGAEAGLAARAKSAGAVCLEEDIRSCPGFTRARECSFFLMDEREGELDGDAVTRALYALLTSARPLWKKGAGCRVYAFSDDNAAVEAIKAVTDEYDREKPMGEVELKVVRDRALTACELLSRVPLYSTLPHKAEGEIWLHTAIFMGGGMGLEMLRTVYHMGQLLDVRLGITVIYPAEGGERLEDVLNAQCPELIQSCTWSGDNELLRVYEGDGEDAFAAPYGALTFIRVPRARMLTRAFLAEKHSYGFGCGREYRLADCDYFIAAAGDDSMNLRLADSLKNALIYEGSVSDARRGRPAPVVAYLLRDGELKGISDLSLTASQFKRESGLLESMPRMCPFGAISERFTLEAVCRDPAGVAGVSAHGTNDKRGRDRVYDDWTNLTREFHLGAKIYSAGCKNVEEYAERATSDPDLRLRLTWLEHRRWNAFMRSDGFVRSFASGSDLDAELKKCADPEYVPPGRFTDKSVVARLHNCLVECAERPRVRLEAVQEKDGRIKADALKDCDMLDRVSAIKAIAKMRTGKKNRPSAVDLKDYDLPERSIIRFMGDRLMLVKKRDAPVTAFRRGEGGRLEAELVRAGKLVPLEGGGYEVFSREATGGRGQLAAPEDYIKVDTEGEPYPNSREFFEAWHIRGEKGLYHQISPPRLAWRAGEHKPEALEHLLSSGRLSLDEKDPEHYFRARLWGTELTAKRDAVLVFYGIRREEGRIADIDFGLVARDEFERTYEVLKD